MPLDQGTIISKWQQKLQDHAERINNVLDIPNKLRASQLRSIEQNLNTQGLKRNMKMCHL
jgi:hypothetical protein